MFRYDICTEADKEIFEKQCKSLENNIPSISKRDRLYDVDGSETQIYMVEGKKVFVHNSIYIGSVFVESEIDLKYYFS